MGKELLLKHGANVEAKDKREQSPLDVASAERPAQVRVHTLFGHTTAFRPPLFPPPGKTRGAGLAAPKANGQLGHLFIGDWARHEFCDALAVARMTSPPPHQKKKNCTNLYSQERSSRECLILFFSS